MADNPRERILEAAYDCFARYGMAKTTVGDVASAARVSRTTVYRYFSGGKEQLIADTVAWEAARFLARLAEATAGVADFRALVEDALVCAHQAVAVHAVLHKMLEAWDQAAAAAAVPVKAPTTDPDRLRRPALRRAMAGGGSGRRVGRPAGPVVFVQHQHRRRIQR